jgi:hypothetical protein
MQEVVTILEAMISSEQSDMSIYNNITNYNFNEKKELEYKSNLNSGIGTIEINNGIINDVTSLNIESGIIMESENSLTSASNQTTELSVNDINVCNNSINITPSYIKNRIIMESKNSSSSVSNQALDEKCYYKNQLLLELEKEGLITPDDKVEKLLLNDLTKPKYLYALKLLFENFQNNFSSQILINSLKSLANPDLFDYYSKDCIARLELHLRTWVAVLEQIQFSQPPIVLSKDLQDKVYSSLVKFADIYYKTIQVDGNLKLNFHQEKDEKYNYNINFLLIHLRDTLNSLRNDETWFQELLKKIKDLLSTILNIIPLSKSAIPNNDCTVLSFLTQVRQSLNFKYPVASYYIDWRIMLIIQHNLFIWSESSEKIISKKFSKLVLMKYI